MVKTPRTRHSKTSREPVTIDLAPGEVARVKAEQEEAPRPASSDLLDDTPAFAGPGEEPSEAAARDPETEPEPETEPKTEPEAEDAPSFVAGEDAPRDTPPPPPPPSAPPSAPPSRGIAGPVTAGLAGGVLALLIAGGLHYAGMLPPAANSSTDTTAIEARLDELQGRVAELAQASGDDAALSDRLTAAEQGIASLTGDIETLRGQIAAGPDAGAPADPGPVEERIAALETAIAGLPDSSAAQSALAALDGQVAALRGEIGTAREAQEAASSRLDALERSLGDLSSRLDEQAEAPGTAIIIAASALKAAIDRGGPFMTELETFASLAPDAPEVAQLRSMAAAGVPTRAQIAAESDAAANAMIAAARPSDAEGGVVDRLWGSAMGLVQVRPIGMVEGNGVPEIVARIDAAVTANDYQRAIDEFDTLPDAAKSAGEAFMARVRARHGADTLIDQALAAALKVKG